MNWSWLSFVVGILVGWLLEWLIDYIFWRRKHRDQEAEIADLKRQLAKAWDAQRESEQQAAQCAEQLSACRDNLAACRDDLVAAEASADALSARAAEAAVPIDLDQKASDAVGAEIEPTEFSPEEDTESAIAAGEVVAGAVPADEVEAADTRVEAVPVEVPKTPEPAPQVGEDVPPSEFSAIEADLAEGAGEDVVEDEAATRAGAVIPVPLAGDDEDAPPPEPQDLTKIEGIGPKISGLLHDAGILTFARLAQTPVERLREVLAAAGPRYRIARPDTWPQQAALAAENKWDELEALQDRLSGGRLVDEPADE
jgi:predicted flap endonuclease-1-like 5' DNA nuclease